MGYFDFQLMLFGFWMLVPVAFLVALVDTRWVVAYASRQRFVARLACLVSYVSILALWRTLVLIVALIVNDVRDALVSEIGVGFMLLGIWLNLRFIFTDKPSVWQLANWRKARTVTG